MWKENDNCSQSFKIRRPPLIHNGDIHTPSVAGHPSVTSPHLEQKIEEESDEEKSPSSEVGNVSERREGEPIQPGFNLSQLLVPSSAENDEDIQPRFLGDRLFAELNHISDDSIDSHPLMVFQGSINGHQAVILLDQGANSNYVSKEFAQRTGIIQRDLKNPVMVTTATGRNYAVTSQLMSTDLRVVGKNMKANLLIVPLGTYDVILGTPWYAAARPKFDWESWTCEGHSVYTKGGRSIGHPGRDARRLLYDYWR